jgi:predicted DCC family thiol-disulfide oxidoreductase YuxK
LRHDGAVGENRRLRHIRVMNTLTPVDPKAACAVFYDGGCPVCSREIALYQRLADGTPTAPQFIDVSRADAEIAPGLSRADALARFHIRNGRGDLVSGAAAFIALWRATPRFRWLGRVASVPPIPTMLEWGYRGFLKLRPLWRR